MRYLQISQKHVWYELSWSSSINKMYSNILKVLDAELATWELNGVEPWDFFCLVHLKSHKCVQLLFSNFICQKENMMYACNTDRYRFAHCGTDMFGEVTTFACCFQHRWHPKKEPILSWSLVTGKRQWLKDRSRCCDPPWHANRLDTQRFARADSQTCFFLCIFLGGGSPHRFCPVILSLPETRGPCPLGFFCQVFLCFAYIMLYVYIYICMVVSISMAFAYWAQPLNCRMLENQLREDEFKADFRHQSFEKTKMPSQNPKWRRISKSGFTGVFICSATITTT